MCFFFQAEDGIRDIGVTGVQTCALPIYEADQLAPSEGLGQPPALEARQVLADAVHLVDGRAGGVQQAGDGLLVFEADRSEEHTSELQSRQYLVCRLLLEKKNCRELALTH